MEIVKQGAHCLTWSGEAGVRAGVKAWELEAGNQLLVALPFEIHEGKRDVSLLRAQWNLLSAHKALPHCRLFRRRSSSVTPTYHQRKRACLMERTAECVLTCGTCLLHGTELHDERRHVMERTPAPPPSVPLPEFLLLLCLKPQHPH